MKQLSEMFAVIAAIGFGALAALGFAPPPPISTTIVFISLASCIVYGYWAGWSDRLNRKPKPLVPLTEREVRAELERLQAENKRLGEEIAHLRPLVWDGRVPKFEKSGACADATRAGEQDALRFVDGADDD